MEISVILCMLKYLLPSEQTSVIYLKCIQIKWINGGVGRWPHIHGKVGEFRLWIYGVHL